MVLHPVFADLIRSAHHIRQYYGLDKAAEPSLGAAFDTWAGGGDHPNTCNDVTADDLLAVSFLGSAVHPHAAIAMLQDQRDRISHHLSHIPVTVRLADLSTSEAFEDHLGPGSHASTLRDLLTNEGDRLHGISPLLASTILSRKRPHLIPIIDQNVLDLVDHGDDWSTWHSALTEEPALRRQLQDIADASGINDSAYAPSTPRLMHVVLSMERAAQRNLDQEIAATTATIQLF